MEDLIKRGGMVREVVKKKLGGMLDNAASLTSCFNARWFYSCKRISTFVLGFEMLRVKQGFKMQE
jgi:hypothetical protein